MWPGNSGDGGVNYPDAFDETIAVAYDRWGKIANFSSKGEKVEWARFPSVNIYSTFLNNGYASLSGTSMGLSIYYRCYLFDACKT